MANEPVEVACRHCVDTDADENEGTCHQYDDPSALSLIHMQHLQKHITVTQIMQ